MPQEGLVGSPPLVDPYASATKGYRAQFEAGRELLAVEAPTQEHCRKIRTHTAVRTRIVARKKSVRNLSLAVSTLG